jgi:nitroimidazol reductase NimA-like FMN-containing flavoprotein (pyridoxamine 5'-phosphate oxidase superfamily)
MAEEIKQTERTRLRRIPKRGHYDRETVNAVLDASFICHVGFMVDGQPYVIPTGYARHGDTLLIHGSSASRMLRNIAEGVDVCVTVTILDGLVLARSAFNHSMNYRSVVVLGKATAIKGDKEKNEALLALSEHFIRGRWDEVRLPTELELKATTVLSLPIDEASAKIREGGPVDDDEDYELDVWAGVLPMQMTTGNPIPDTKLKEGIELPSSVKKYPSP